jgi:hypothetical protein
MSSHIVATAAVSLDSGMPRPATARLATARRAAAFALAATALALMLAGGFLPWLTVFNGLSAVRGFSLDGGLLAFILLSALAMLFVQARAGGARILRPIAIAGAFAVVADSLYSAWRISAFVAAPGPDGVLSAPALGPGPYVFAAAGVVLLAAALVAPAAAGRLAMRVALRLTLAVLLLAAAVIHLILTPEHLGISTVLGLGFLAAGLAQSALAGLAVGASERLQPFVMYAIIVVNIALIAIYLYAVLVGLPFEAGHADDDAGLRIGVGEAVDVKGAVDLIAEVAAVGIAAFLALGGERRTRPER